MGNRERKQNMGISEAPGGDLAPHQQNAATLTGNKRPPTQMEIYYIYCKMGRP